MTEPTAPAEMSTRGLECWTSTTNEFDLSTTETELLVEVCRRLDECEELRHAIGRDGVTVAGSTGQVRANPCLTELRQHRLALARLMSQLAMPDASDKALRTPRQGRAHRAAEARWSGHLKHADALKGSVGEA